MDVDKKFEYINIIIAGGFFCEISGSLYYIDTKISNQQKVYLDYIYNKAYNEAVLEGAYKEKEYLELCKKNNTWNDNKMQEVTDLYKQIEIGKKKYYVNFYNDTQKKVLKKKIKSLNDDIRKILIEKIILCSGITAEYFAEKQKKRCKYEMMVKDVESNKFNSYDFIDENFENELEIAINRNSRTEEEIRDIARTNPWRTTWEISKTNFRGMFGVDVGGCTQDQFSLCYWSQFYDGIFAGYERPSNDILNDDIALDVWYELKINEQSSENSLGLSEKTSKHQEVFVKTDKNNAEKIYDMNDKHVRSAMKKRDNIIKENGGISEGDLLKKQGRVQGELFIKGK